MSADNTKQVKSVHKQSVLLVEDDIINYSELKQALIELNYQVTGHINSTQKISEQCIQTLPNFLILNTHAPTKEILKELTYIDQLTPLPILVFAKQDTQSLIQSSIKAGVSAYIVNQIQPTRLNSLIAVACERFKQRQLLVKELKQTKNQLADRKIVERAKGYVMQQKNITEQQAFSLLRKMAMDNGQTLATVSKNVTDVYDLLAKSVN